MSLTVVRRSGSAVPATVLSTHEEFGIRTADIAFPSRRFWGEGEAPIRIVETNIDERRLERLPTPAEQFARPVPDDNWSAQSRRSLGRLFAHYILGEDP